MKRELNFKQKQEERKRIKDLFLTSYPEGCCKISKGESWLHGSVKAQVFHFLKANNYEVWSEPTLKGLKSHPDLICLHNNGSSAYIIEIVVSESEKSILEKELKYPLPIKVVYTKDFKYQEFCL